MEQPKICVVGAGAIGGFLAVKLASAGHNVSIIDRGLQLDAIRSSGLRLLYKEDGTEVSIQVPAYGDDSIGPQDIIILAVKAHQIPDVAKQVAALMHSGSLLVTVQNGVPWWYFQRQGGELEGQLLETIDPGGSVSQYLDPANIIGCVAYPAVENVGPGVIRHIEGTRFPVGELDNSKSSRVKQLAELFVTAGLKSPVLDDLRGEIWLKLWGALAFNPISMLTGATLVDICSNGHSRDLAAGMMREAELIACRLGIDFRVPLERRIQGAERVGPHKTSTLQDLEGGRKTELDALLGAVIELGRLTGTATPQCEAVYATCKLLEETRLADKL